MENTIREESNKKNLSRAQTGNEMHCNINTLARLAMVAKVWSLNAWKRDQEFKVSMFYI